jgi:hypothetical protein
MGSGGGGRAGRALSGSSSVERSAMKRQRMRIIRTQGGSLRKNRSKKEAFSILYR